MIGVTLGCMTCIIVQVSAHYRTNLKCCDDFTEKAIFFTRLRLTFQVCTIMGTASRIRNPYCLQKRCVRIVFVKTVGMASVSDAKVREKTTKNTCFAALKHTTPRIFQSSWLKVLKNVLLDKSRLIIGPLLLQLPWRLHPLHLQSSWKALDQNWHCHSGIACQRHNFSSRHHRRHRSLEGRPFC